MDRQARRDGKQSQDARRTAELFGRSKTETTHNIAESQGPGACKAARPAGKQLIRRDELRRIVPLSDTTIYELEQRGAFPKRLFLTSRCVAWDLGEIEAWIEERRRLSEGGAIERAPTPDVSLRKTRPVRR